MKLFAACSIWLLLLSSFVQANVVWDKEINEFKTSFSLEQSNNLYHQASNQINDTAGHLSANYKLLKLFEGFGISFPVTLSQKSYLEQSQLNAFSYSVSPNIHFFISDKTSVDVMFNKSKSEVLPGQEGAEFVNSDTSLIVLNTDSANLNLNLGRDHNSQFLDMSISYNQNTQKVKDAQLNTHETVGLSSTYGHRISEDTYLLANAKMSQSKRSLSTTDLKELGFGFKTSIGGSHKLNLIAGLYKRKGDEQSDGHFWVASDIWHISEQNQINISTSQRSQVSLSNDTLTQLNTDYQLNWSYKLSKTHLLSLSLKKNKQKFEQTFRKYNKDLISLSWTWLFIDDMTLRSNVQYINTTDSQTTLNNSEHRQSKIDEININIEVAYKW